MFSNFDLIKTQPVVHVADVKPLEMNRECISNELHTLVPELRRLFPEECVNTADYCYWEVRDWRDNMPDDASIAWHLDGSLAGYPAKYCVFWSNTIPTEVCTLPDLRPVTLEPFGVYLINNVQVVHRMPPDAVNVTERWFAVMRIGGTGKNSLKSYSDMRSSCVLNSLSTHVPCRTYAADIEKSSGWTTVNHRYL